MLWYSNGTDNYAPYLQRQDQKHVTTVHIKKTYVYISSVAVKQRNVMSNSLTRQL